MERGIISVAIDGDQMRIKYSKIEIDIKFGI